MTTIPQPGDVWEKDGKRRRVDEVFDDEDGRTFRLRWNGRSKSTWCSTWFEWQVGATLIERDGKAVTHE